MLVGQHGEVLLSDFGIATVAHSTGSLELQTIVGTAPYMAPEQFQGHPRPASDQYSLGIVVYEWLCGSPPFQGSLPEVAMKHSMTPPTPPRDVQPTIPLEIERVVLTALAKDPRERYASVLAFAQALEQAYRAAPVSFPERAYTMEPLTSPRPLDLGIQRAAKNREASEEPQGTAINQTVPSSLSTQEKSIKSVEPVRQLTQRRQTRRSLLLLGAGAVIGASVTSFVSSQLTNRVPSGGRAKASPGNGSGSIIVGAWRGPDHDERLLWSTFDGQTWAPEQLVGNGSVGSSLGPTLVAWQGTLYLVRKGLDNDTNIFWSTFNKDTSLWTAQRIVTFSNGDTPATNSAVALAPLQEKLYLAWKGGAMIPPSTGQLSMDIPGRCNSQYFSIMVQALDQPLQPSRTNSI